MNIRLIKLKIVDENPGFHHQCLILYYGNKVSLGVQGGKIDSNLETANVYFDWGFTVDTLNDCLLKVCTILERNVPNAVNIKYVVRNQAIKSDNVIANADVIVSYDIQNVDDF